jgi:hypothetical protein
VFISNKLGIIAGFNINIRKVYNDTVLAELLCDSSRINPYHYYLIQPDVKIYFFLFQETGKEAGRHML